MKRVLCSAFSLVVLFTVLRAGPAQAGTTCGELVGQSLLNGLSSVASAELRTIKSGYDYCIVRAELADSPLKVEVRLPTSGWNGRLVYLGGGGFNGQIANFTADASYFSRSSIDERYAVVVSNGGYDGPPFTEPAYFEARFARDAQKLVDFMFQSVHRALPQAQEVVRRFYGSLPTKKYFEGCSTGGHEAMIQAQRYPRDFDGVVARGPAANFVGLYTQFHRIARLVRTPEGRLSPAKQDLLAKAVLARCDAKDGLADGILSNVRACDFDPRTLRCPNGADSGDKCLSDAQLATVQAITTPYASSDGSIAHAGYNFGGENLPESWGSYIWPSERAAGDTIQGLFSDAFIRGIVTSDPKYVTSQWNANDWLPTLQLINRLFQATDADLSPLAAHGGKLIIWNGEMDTSTSSRDNTKYYERVVSQLGQARADEFVELFLAPGVGHCGGGPGADRVDLLRAISTWTEQGTPPSRQSLNLEKYDATGKLLSARPMCKFPAYPRYKGRGNVNSASSFVCTSG